ncbi:MAG TPA: aminotransferase class I/II-fold pyridoxal phosphate-dependent enzyme, partial [Synergistaceae bacterium]|nr:aminotransferase class I/II-fold pyridoxal phosphate-dependent enzyme [Synergistaceae bacterium]
MSLWKECFSNASQALQPSPIREMLHVIRQPGMISFAGGMPDPAIFPVEEFYQCASILEKEGRDVLQYGTTEGYAPLKEFLATWLAPRLGRTPKMEELLITTGSTQVIDLLNWATINENDAIIVENPTFLGSTLNMHNHGAHFLPVSCDEKGMLVEDLPQLIEGALKEGRKVRY